VGSRGERRERGNVGPLTRSEIHKRAFGEGGEPAPEGVYKREFNQNELLLLKFFEKWGAANDA